MKQQIQIKIIPCLSSITKAAKQQHVKLRTEARLYSRRGAEGRDVLSGANTCLLDDKEGNIQGSINEDEKK
jgi:hypothetical protein